MARGHLEIGCNPAVVHVGGDLEIDCPEVCRCVLYRNSHALFQPDAWSGAGQPEVRPIFPHQQAAETLQKRSFFENLVRWTMGGVFVEDIALARKDVDRITVQEGTEEARDVIARQMQVGSALESGLVLPAGQEPIPLTDPRILQQQPVFQHIEKPLDPHIVLTRGLLG